MANLVETIFSEVAELFPGNGGLRPDESEWAYADAIVGRELERYWKPGEVHLFAPKWHNRAWLRCQIKRHLVKNSATIADAYEILRAAEWRLAS